MTFEWYAEFILEHDVNVYSITVFDHNEKSIVSIRSKEPLDVIEQMRLGINKELKTHYGGKFNHEIFESKLISSLPGREERVIPITVYGESKVDSDPDSINLVEFTEEAPKKEGYYFYSGDGSSENISIVYIDSNGATTHVKKNLITTSENKPIWSVSPVKIPESVEIINGEW